MGSGASIPGISWQSDSLPHPARFCRVLLVVHLSLRKTRVNENLLVLHFDPSPDFLSENCDTFAILAVKSFNR